MAFVENAIDVLDFNGCIVDQDAYCKRQAAQSHDVNRSSQKTQDNDRRQN